MMFVKSSWICKSLLILALSILLHYLPKYLIRSFGFAINFRYHHLKLYSEDESGPQSTKKPVVVETYNEIVFPDPSEGFYARVQKHPAVIVPRLPVTLNFPSGNAITIYLTS